MGSISKRALKIAYYPAGFGLFVGVSGAMKGSAPPLAKFVLSLFVGPAMAFVLGVPVFLVALLIYWMRE